jgi:hypothetical protein
MKKILSIAVFAFILLATKSFGQSNITWVIKDNLGQGALKTKTEFSCAFVGFANQNEATAFYQKIRSNADVASCEDMGKDASGNYSVKITMKDTHDKKYYAAWANKLGVTNITANGETHTPREWLEKK